MYEQKVVHAENVEALNDKVSRMVEGGWDAVGMPVYQPANTVSLADDMKLYEPAFFLANLHT